MAVTKPIPVRFTAHADQRLSSLSSRNGMKKAELIRIAVDKMLCEVEKTGRLDYSMSFAAPAVVAEEVRGPVTQIGTQNFTPDAAQRGASVPYRQRARKK